MTRRAKHLLGPDSDINASGQKFYGLRGAKKEPPKRPKGITEEEVEETRRQIIEREARKRARQDERRRLKESYLAELDSLDEAYSADKLGEEDYRRKRSRIMKKLSNLKPSKRKKKRL